MGKMRETAEFIRYAVDPRKAKAAVLATELVITTMLVGCRSQLVRDTNRFEAELEALRAAHSAELRQIIEKAENGIYATQYLASSYESDAWALGQWLDCLDARYKLSQEAKALACWVVFNRVDSDQYPDNVESVLRQNGQFCEYSDEEAPTEGNMVIATNQVSRWKNGDIRPVPSRAVFITVSSDGVELRDSFEESRNTGYWRA